MKIKINDLVEFRKELFWVYYIKKQDAIILPMSNLDFENELLKLEGAIQVNISRLKLHVSG